MYILFLVLSVTQCMLKLISINPSVQLKFEHKKYYKHSIICWFFFIQLQVNDNVYPDAYISSEFYCVKMKRFNCLIWQVFERNSSEVCCLLVLIQKQNFIDPRVKKRFFSQQNITHQRSKCQRYTNFKWNEKKNTCKMPIDKLLITNS